MSGRSVPRMKYLIRQLDPALMSQLVPKLSAETSDSVRLEASEFMEQHHLGGLYVVGFNLQQDVSI